MSNTRFSLTTTVLLVVALIAPLNTKAQQSGEIILYSQDFESGQASEWSLEPGWEIVAQQDGHVLQGSGHAWARLNQGLWDDYFLRFRLKLNQGESALHANIRLIGAARYFIGFNTRGMYLSRQDNEQTFHNNLATASYPSAGWHTIEITASAGLITVSVDGKSRIRYTDPAPLTMGGVAFESLAKSTVWVDDVVVGQETTEGAGTSAPAASPPARSAQTGMDQTWQYLGGPLGGLGYDVRMRPDNPDVMYVTDAEAGVFRSQDGGRSWQPINKGITTRTGSTGEIIPVFCLTIDPHNPDIVWAGTQFLTGLYKSMDGGDSWVKMDRGLEGTGLTLRGITVDPRSSDIVYVAGEVSSWEWAGKVINGNQFDKTKGVVYKTTDGGKLWTKVWFGDDLARYIWIDPRNPEVVYVSTGIFDREAANSDYATGQAGGVGVIKSTDGGKTWLPVNNGLENLYIGSLFMHPQNPDILLAGAGCVTYPQGSGVYLTTDGGASWKKTLDTYAVASVEFSLSDPNIAYAGEVNAFFRSEDGGVTWQQMTPTNQGMWGPAGLAVGTPIDIQVDPRNPDRLFVNAYGGGNFISEDGGATWTEASAGYSGGMVRDLALDPRYASRVYAAVRSGIFLSGDGGLNWTGIASGQFRILDWHAVAVHPTNPQIVLSELTCDRDLLFSSNGGQSWQKALQLQGNVGFRDIEFAPSDPNVVYAGSAGYFSCGAFQDDLPGQGVFVSHDSGRSWVGANDMHTQDAAVFQLAIHPTDPQTVFAATNNNGLVKSTDGGKSWQPVAPDKFGKSSAVCVQISPHDPNLLLAGRYQSGLLRSQDDGATWKLSATGLMAESLIVDIVFDPNDPNLVYLADLSSGVYRSQDRGITWKAINDGLALRAVNDLALSGDGLHLYAGTEGRGVFRLDLNGQPPKPAAAQASPATPTAAAASTATWPAQPATSLPAAPGSTSPTQAAPSQLTATPAGKTGLPCLSSYSITLLAFVGVLGLSQWQRRKVNDQKTD